MPFDIPSAPREHAPAPTFMPFKKRQALIALGLTALFALAVALFSISAPNSFPQNALITIPSGVSAPQYARILQEAHVIRSQTLFRIIARITGSDGHLDPGAYVFATPANVLTVWYRTAHAKHGVNPVRVTLTEGMTSFNMADTLSQKLPGFNSAAFTNAASTSEGYLFPETYFFMPGDTSEQIVERLNTEFKSQVASITPQVAASGRSLGDLVTMASILEREAKSPEDMRMVAGILWNRIRVGMPLQVDAAFGYAHGEDGYTPTAADLDSDSPYNTYRRYGLPPTPISNPGIEAILAAAMPTPTKDLYYLTGTDGAMHYAATFEEHKRNKELYLK